jgi:hypothetical protein
MAEAVAPAQCVASYMLNLTPYPSCCMRGTLAEEPGGHRSRLGPVIWHLSDANTSSLLLLGVEPRAAPESRNW